MSESLDQTIPVPELTAEEIQARVLHRDGLMLVIDKPAGLPVHRGPKGGANLEASFDGLRYGLPRPPVLAHRLDKDTSGCLVLGRHRKATASLGLLFKHGKIGKTYWAVVESRHHLESMRPLRRPRLAGARAGHRPHPPTARAHISDGLADRRRQHLRQRTSFWRTHPASAFPRDRDSDFKEQGAGARGGAGARAHAGAAEVVWMERGIEVRGWDRRPATTVIIREGG